MMKFSAALLAAVAVWSCASATEAERMGAPATGSGGTAQYKQDENVFPVGAIPAGSLRDAGRNRDIELAVEYPTRGGPFPVIVFSHGWGMSKDDYISLTGYWSGHGFVVVKPSHADAGALKPIMEKRRQQRREALEKLREEKGSRAEQKSDGDAPPAPEPAAETLWMKLSPGQLAERARDVSFIVDSLDALEQKYPELAGKMRKDAIAVAGHSLGAYTAMLLGGTVAEFSGAPPIRVADARVKAILAMSPQGIGPEQGLSAGSWAALRIPAMFMTGSLDRGLGGGGDPKWRRGGFADSPAGDKFFINITGARHSTFAGALLDIDDLPVQGTRRPVADEGWGGTARQHRTSASGTERGYLRDRRIVGQIKTITTAFFDAYLKNDEAGRNFVKPGGTLDKMNGPDVAVERK